MYCCLLGVPRCGSRILRPKIANIVKWICVSEPSYLWLVSRAHLRVLEAFGFLILKYAFSKAVTKSNWEIFWIWIMKNSKIFKKQYVEWSEANKREELDRVQNALWSGRGGGGFRASDCGREKLRMDKRKLGYSVKTIFLAFFIVAWCLEVKEVRVLSSIM